MMRQAWPITAATGAALSGLLLLFAPAPIVQAVAVTFGAASSQADIKGARIDDAKLEVRAPVACVGSQLIELTGVVVRSDSVAIATAGGCEVRIKNSHIVGRIAVQTAGGTVTVENTIIEGGTLAVQMAGDSTVSIKSSTVTGSVQRAAGTFKDLGNNVFR